MVDQYGLAPSRCAARPRLGVEAMALYHHVNGREDLLEAMVAQLVEGIRVDRRASRSGPPTAGRPSSSTSPTRSAPSPSTTPSSSRSSPPAHPPRPWLRPPLRNLALVEDFLDGLMSPGAERGQRGPRLQGVHRLPARTPAARGRAGRGAHGPAGGAARRGRRRRAQRRPAARPRRLPHAACASSPDCAATTPTPTSSTPSRRCWTASTSSSASRPPVALGGAGR